MKGNLFFDCNICRLLQNGLSDLATQYFLMIQGYRIGFMMIYLNLAGKCPAWIEGDQDQGMWTQGKWKLSTRGRRKCTRAFRQNRRQEEWFLPKVVLIQRDLCGLECVLMSHLPIGETAEQQTVVRYGLRSTVYGLRSKVNGLRYGSDR